MKNLAMVAATWGLLWAGAARAAAPGQGQSPRAASAPASTRPEQAQAGFTVHEWAVQIRSSAYVVNSIAGGLNHPGKEPNAVLTPPRELIDGLPGFVLRHAKEYRPEPKYRNWNKPVIHFYGRDGMDVSVEVGTPLGRPIAYWPKPRLVEQTIWRMGSGMTDALGMKWTGKLTVEPGAGLLKEVPAEHWWSTVRQVPGLYLRTDGGTERFVFYEAFALQDSPLQAVVSADAVTLTNTYHRPSGPVVVILNDGGKRHFLCVKDVPPAGKAKLSKDELLGAGGEEAGLLEACRRQWTAFRMSGPEANAIVETWKSDLLERPGFLVISAMPGDMYDRMFPLKIAPKPAEVVRVGMVFDALAGQPARADWLPGLQEAMRSWAKDLSAGEFKTRRQAAERFAQAGDLARPVLEELSKSKDVEAAAQAKALLEQLRVRIDLPR